MGTAASASYVSLLLHPLAHTLVNLPGQTVLDAAVHHMTGPSSLSCYRSQMCIVNPFPIALDSELSMEG